MTEEQASQTESQPPMEPVEPETQPIAEATLASTQENHSHDGSNHESSKNKEEGDDKLMAVLAYLGVLIIVPLLAAKDKAFVKFHIKQGLVLVIAWALVWAINMIAIPFNFLAPIMSFLVFVLALVGILNAVGGKKKELPILGQYGKYFDDMLG